MRAKSIFTDNIFGKLIIVLGVIGFLASLILSYEKYSIALDPEHVPSCSISPIVACESVLASGADALFFSVPNSFFGIAAFSALMSVGVMMLAGAKFKDWFWKLFYMLTIAGIGSILFFLYQSLYVIGSLCIYCMTTWAVVIALLFYTTIFLVEKKLLKVPKFKQKIWPIVVNNHYGVLFLIYLSIFGLILFRFREYFETVWF